MSDLESEIIGFAIVSIVVVGLALLASKFSKKS